MNKRIIAFCSLLFILPTFTSCGVGNEIKNTIGFKYYLNDAAQTCTIAALKGFNYENVVIPNAIKTENGKIYNVVGINSNQNNVYDDICVDFLEGNKYIKTLTIDNQYIEVLPWDVFRDTSLKYVDMSKATKLAYFGDHAFTNSPIEEMILPPNLIQTYTGVFSQTNIKSITFPDTYIDMGIDTFFDCKYLQSVDLGSSITYVSGSCFERTPSLKKVVCPNVETFSQHSFRETPSLVKVDLSKATYIGYMAFYRSNIKEANLKDVFLETNCFRESNIESVTIENCDRIPYKAFGDCKKLSTINLNGKINQIESNAFKSTLITNLVLPNTVKFIGSEAFYGCSKLNSITFSNTLESISTNAFKKCTSLKSIDLPSSLKRIYDGAFVDTGIKEVTISKSIEMLGTCFPKNCEIIYI